MGLVQRVRSVSQQMAMVFDETKIRRDLDQLEKEVSLNPTNIFTLQQLCNLYQAAGNNEKAVAVLCQVAELYRERNEPEFTLAFLRKAERMCLPEQRVNLLCQIVDLNIQLQKYEDAYQRMVNVLEILIREGKATIALGLVNTLPPLGLKDARYRKELVEYVNLHREEWAQGSKGTWILEESEKPPVEVTSRQLEMKFPNHTLLVVDDEPGVLQLLTMALKRLGCKIVTASNGEEAYQKAVETCPNLIISDLMMPQMDGSQLFTSLRAHPTLCQVPFVCLTSNSLEKERIAALDRGVEDFWVKPFSLAELVLRVGKLLLRHQKQPDMVGQLTQIAFPELLQLLDHGQKTGLLRLRSEGQEATLYFHQGTLVQAELGPYSGELVAYKLVYWMTGEFSFFSQPVDCQTTIPYSTQQLLIEGLRRFDEANQLIDDVFPDLSKVYGFQFDPQKLLFEPELNPYLARLRAVLNGRNTLQDCCHELSGELEVLILAAELLEQHILVPDLTFDRMD